MLRGNFLFYILLILIAKQVPSGTKVSGLNSLGKEDRTTVENHFDQELKRKREQKELTFSEEVKYFSFLPNAILLIFTGR